ncbi:hypothetical protein JNK13_01745 [bacterium]|nr:hypothetical protein [bacterium]
MSEEIQEKFDPKATLRQAVEFVAKHADGYPTVEGQPHLASLLRSVKKAIEGNLKIVEDQATQGDFPNQATTLMFALEGIIARVSSYSPLNDWLRVDTEQQEAFILQCQHVVEYLRKLHAFLNEKVEQGWVGKGGGTPGIG